MALNSVSDNTKQEALGYYGEVVDLIDKKAQVEHTSIYIFNVVLAIGYSPIAPWHNLTHASPTECV